MAVESVIYFLFLAILSFRYIYSSLNVFDRHSCVSEIDNYVNVENDKASSFLTCANSCEDNCYGVVFSNEDGDRLCVKLLEAQYIPRGASLTTCGIPTNTFQVWKKYFKVRLPQQLDVNAEDIVNEGRSDNRELANPKTIYIPMEMTPGRAIAIYGNVPKRNGCFRVNLMCGPNITDERPFHIGFYFNCCKAYGIFVYQIAQGKRTKISKYENQIHVPNEANFTLSIKFMPDKKMTIKVNNNNYTINHVPLVDPSTISHMYIESRGVPFSVYKIVVEEFYLRTHN